MANQSLRLFFFAALAPLAWAAPTVSGVANAADFTASVAPGSLASLFGAGLAAGTGAPSSLPIPTTLNGVTVNVNNRPAPITYLSPTQINFQVPAATAPGSATITVTYNSQTSNAFAFTVAATAPGIFLTVNQDSSVNAANKPASSGSTVVVYLTGIGATNPAVADGAASPSGPLAVPPNGTATIGGATAPVVFLGLTPGFVGLAQANLQVPNLANGDYPLVITVAGRSSKAATVTVTGTGATQGGGGVPPGLPDGAKCVSGMVDYLTFSLATKASTLADEVSIGGTKFCATCDLKPPLYGNFVDKLETARIEGLNVDVCYDGLGTLNYVRMRQ